MNDLEIYIVLNMKNDFTCLRLSQIILFCKFHISLFMTNEEVASIFFVIRHARSGRSHLFCKLRTERST